MAQIKTLVDGGIRVVFDLPESAIRETAMLLECKRQGIPLIASLEADDAYRDKAKSGVDFDPDDL